MPERPVAVCRELTKRFEEVIRGTAAEVAARVRRAAEGRDHARARRGRAARRATRSDALAAVAELVAGGSCRGGRRRSVVARLTGLARNTLYRALAVIRFDNSRQLGMLPRRVVFKLATAVVVLVAVLLGRACAPGAQLPGRWPVDGPVLRPFVDGDDPYAGGQHRGIDIGGADGEPRCRAPAAGVVSFAGRCRTRGSVLTIRTEDGYSVTLVHLGSIGVAVERRSARARSSARSARAASRKAPSRTFTSASG